jgi:hypothetical protein
MDKKIKYGAVVVEACYVCNATRNNLFDGVDMVEIGKIIYKKWKERSFV